MTQRDIENFFSFNSCFYFILILLKCGPYSGWKPCITLYLFVIQVSVKYDEHVSPDLI